MPLSDYSSLIKLLTPLLTAVAEHLPVGTPPYVVILIKLALDMLSRFTWYGGGLMESERPDAPPMHDWNPVALVAWAKERANSGEQP